MRKIIYEPFKTLEDQESFEKSLELEANRNLNPEYEEGTEYDIKMAEESERLCDITFGRLEERLIRLSE